LAIDRRLQFWDGIATALNNLGNLSRQQTDLDEAESYYEESLSICRTHGLLVRDPMYSLGLLALQREQYPLAAQRFIGYFDSIHGEYDQGSVLSLLSGMAAAAAGSGQVERAARLWGAAQALMDSLAGRLGLYNPQEFERHIQLARFALGQPAFDALVSAGRMMSFEGAVDFALAKAG
jgi:tetratricopeptide (TPR) repeat protein